MSNCTIVFDVDDTICSNLKRQGYEKAIANINVIEKINYLHDELGFEIILHTSRGMKSCNNDIIKAMDKNKSILEKWLKENNVHYDMLIFGKPFADLYVDDKAMTPKDFVDKDFCQLNNGGSGNKIYRLGNIVKKTYRSFEDIQRVLIWYDDNKLLKKPSIISTTDDSIYMEYIEGKEMVKSATFATFCNIVRTIFQESHITEGTSFNLDKHIEILKKNYCNVNDGYFSGVHNYRVDKCIEYLENNKYDFSRFNSICHGDMILSNIITDEEEELYYIDPQYDRDASSYLLDFAKLRMSLSGYEKMFGLTDRDFSYYRNDLDKVLIDRGIYKMVLWLQMMYTIRLTRYKKNKEKVMSLEERLVRENADIFRGM